MIQRIIDKCLLLTCCSMLYFFSYGEKNLMFFLPILATVILGIISLLVKSPFFLVPVYFIFIALCCFFPLLPIFLPIIFYDLSYTAFKWCIVFAGIPFLFTGGSFSTIVIAFTALFLALSVILYVKTSSIEILQKDYEAFRKTSRELTLVQEEKNRSILENQDYEIQTATLNERNRISKEIHDRIGHLLSRSLLQIGALLTISKEEPVKEALTELKISISEGMDSIRETIHNIHNESIDLEGTLSKLIREFTFCPINYEYQLHSAPSVKIKYCLIAITKESLTNITKHSKGDNVAVRLTEGTEHYSLSIEDNGPVSERTKLLITKCQGRSEYPEGLGLQSINDRIKGLSGEFAISTDHGFKLSITIPKEEK